MVPAKTPRNRDSGAASGTRPPARISVQPGPGGWLLVTIERARPRRFNIALDELPDLMGKLAPYCQPVTVTRQPAAYCAACGTALDSAGDCPAGCGARMPARVVLPGGAS